MIPLYKLLPLSFLLSTSLSHLSAMFNDKWNNLNFMTDPNYIKTLTPKQMERNMNNRGMGGLYGEYNKTMGGQALSLGLKNPSSSSSHDDSSGNSDSDSDNSSNSDNDS